MASYTDNYALTKPTMAESADIRVINSNMDTVDDVMHSTQISLAPAYDMHETYNTGDVVMYELLMYECLEDEVTGAWDATKWQRTTAGEHGGGSDVTVTQIQTEGKAVASIAVDGVSTNILIPELKVYGEATGDLITIEDAMEAPLEECKVTLEPQQDLNGYEYPWPAGGGKNIYDPTNIEQGGFLATGRNDETSSADHNNRIRSTNFIKLDEGADYTLSFTGSVTLNVTVSFYADADYTISRSSYTAWSASPFTFNVPTGTPYIRLLFKNTDGTALAPSALTTIMLEKGSTATAYEPYSNICPISGFAEANVSVVGKNLFDAQDIVTKSNHTTYTYIEDGYLHYNAGNPTVNGINWYGLNFPCPLTFSGSVKNFASANENVIFYATFDDGTQSLITVVHQLTPNEEKSFSVIIGVSGKKLVSLNNSWASARQLGLNLATTQLELGSTATEYEPYNGHTYTIPFVDSQGNPVEVFGGTLDVTSGELVVDRAYVDMGTINWVYSENANVFGSNQFTPYVLTNGKLTCSQYKWNSTPSVSPTNLNNGEISASPYFNRQTVMVKDTRYTDATAFKTAMNGVQLVYELATPQEIQLTPTEVNLLRGINNLWSDGEMYIKYRRDIEMLLQRIADSLGGNA